MNKFIFTVFLLITLGCSKSNETNDNMSRELSVSVNAVRVTSPYISNNWEVWLAFNKTVSMTGNIIVQHDLWDRGQFKKTYIDTIDFKIENTNFYSYRSNRNANYQGPEIKNIKVNKFTQTAGNYNVSIK
jgi:hypothetical protein